MFVYLVRFYVEAAVLFWLGKSLTPVATLQLRILLSKVSFHIMVQRYEH